MTQIKQSKPATVGLKGISKHFGSFKAVDDISLDIKGGEFMTFLGPSGSGKTTTLKMVAGFIEQTKGDVLIDGQLVKAPPHKRNIGMVFQNYALFPHMTAAENIAFPLQMRGMSKAKQKEMVERTLELVQLGDRGGQLPRQLSGGQQQRIALARALVFEPRVVLMDEPLGALDKKLREYLQLEIRRIQQNLNITMIYVTHDQEEALVMSDRITVFNEGRIEQVGTGEELYESPNSRFVADFIGESNMFEGAMDSGSLKLNDVKLQLPAGSTNSGKGNLVVRPERLHVYDNYDAIPNGNNVLRAKVKDVIYLGSERKFELIIDGDKEIIGRHQVGMSDVNPQVGDEVFAAWHVDHGVVVTR